MISISPSNTTLVIVKKRKDTSFLQLHVNTFDKFSCKKNQTDSDNLFSGSKQNKLKKVVKMCINYETILNIINIELQKVS